MQLADYPRPIGDNGRGMHWVPTIQSDNATVDKYVQEMKDMHVKWAVILNDNCTIGQNDYLVKKLVDNGIMPVMRIFTDGGAPIQGDIKALVEHYKALGVDYYQLYNEPNLNMENQGQTPDPIRYVDKWLPAAKAVTEAGGLPGFGALSPMGDYDDLEFFNKALTEIKARGETGTMDHAWIGVHNYTGNRPLDFTGDNDGFLSFRWFDQSVRQILGRSLPIIGTEGGTHVGVGNDRSRPTISQEDQIAMVKGAYEYMKNAEPYYFSYTYWAVANEAGGGKDSSFENHALFHTNSTNPVVAALKGMPDQTRANLPTPSATATRATTGVQTTNSPFSTQSTSAAEKSKAAAEAITKKTTTPVETNTPSAFGQKVVNEAKKYLGLDYVWGGESPDPGFDCTGFTWYIMKQLGHDFPLHDLEGQSATGKQVAKANLQPGDLVFFQNTYRQGISHVGVYAGDGKFIHAASEKLGVITSRLDEPYWSSRYLSATRPFTK
jgi:cell wall-associated NlpC family hydrolase